MKGVKPCAVAVQGEAPPPLSPVLTNGAQLMEANLKPATPEPRGSTASLDGSEGGSRAASESSELAANKEAHKKGRFKVAPALPPSVIFLFVLVI